jgi:hypothetical protein
MTDGRIFLAKNVLREQWGITDGVTACQRTGKRGFSVEQAFGPDHHPLSEIAICKLIGGEIVIRLTCYAQEVPVGKVMTGGGVAGAERGDGTGTIPGSENQAARVAISLDPGKRTFLTGYMNEVGCGDVDWLRPAARKRLPDGVWLTTPQKTRAVDSPYRPSPAFSTMVWVIFHCFALGLVSCLVALLY